MLHHNIENLSIPAVVIAHTITFSDTTDKIEAKGVLKLLNDSCNCDVLKCWQKVNAFVFYSLDKMALQKILQGVQEQKDPFTNLPTDVFYKRASLYLQDDSNGTDPNNNIDTCIAILDNIGNPFVNSKTYYFWCKEIMNSRGANVLIYSRLYSFFSPRRYLSTPLSPLNEPRKDLDGDGDLD